VVKRYIREKLAQPGTYIVAVVVGSLINLYGQILVPLARGQQHPFDHFIAEFQAYPLLVSLSIVLGFCFPLVVGVLSAVMARYAQRHVESRAWLPDYKPDPVFRVDRKGEILDMGTTTASVFEQHGIKTAEAVLGNELWAKARMSTTPLEPCGKTEFSGRDYIVSLSIAPDDTLNIYMSAAL
jgi:hypothetical protein